MQALLVPDLAAEAYDGLAPAYDTFTAGHEYVRWLDYLEVDELSGPFARAIQPPMLQLLRHLIISGCAENDDGLKELASLTDLTGLKLDRTKVTPDGLKHLAPLKNLTTLKLDKEIIKPDIFFAQIHMFNQKGLA